MNLYKAKIIIDHIKIRLYIVACNYRQAEEKIKSKLESNYEIVHLALIAKEDNNFTENILID